MELSRKSILEIEAQCHGRTRHFSVPASEFTKMVWPIEKLGGEAIIAAGAGAKDHARAAIQYLSGDIERRRIFTHTGWRRLGGKWFYLHAAGAIGSDGLYDSVAVKLPPNLAPFRLPEPPTGEELKDVILASFRLLDSLHFRGPFRFTRASGVPYSEIRISVSTRRV